MQLQQMQLQQMQLQQMQLQQMQLQHMQMRAPNLTGNGNGWTQSAHNTISSVNNNNMGLPMGMGMNFGAPIRSGAAPQPTQVEGE